MTVGSTQFEALVREVDRLAGIGFFDEPVTCQIGVGSFIPVHCHYFRFQKGIDEWIDDSSLIITHGGTTVISLLERRKRFVAIANTQLSADHQSQMLRALSKQVFLHWSRSVGDLAKLVELARASTPPSFTMPRLAQDLRDFIDAS